MNEASASLNRLKTNWIAGDGIQNHLVHHAVSSARVAVVMPTGHPARLAPRARRSRSVVPPAFRFDTFDTNGNVLAWSGLPQYAG